MGKLTIVLGVIVVGALVAWAFFTMTDVDDVEVGQCFESWDEFDGGTSGTYVPRSVSNADCTEPHAVQAFHVINTGTSSVCSAAFDRSIRNPEGLDLEWFAVTVQKRFETEVDKIICFVGHADGESLITGSLLDGES